MSSLGEVCLPGEQVRLLKIINLPLPDLSPTSNEVSNVLELKTITRQRNTDQAVVPNFDPLSHRMKHPQKNIIYTIDPMGYSGKQVIPLEMTIETEGRRAWFRHSEKQRRELSICCLFQMNKCNVGSKCRQLHVNRAYLSWLRERQATYVNCCYSCGDKASQRKEFRIVVECYRIFIVFSIKNNTPSNQVSPPNTPQNCLEVPWHFLSCTRGLITRCWKKMFFSVESSLHDLFISGGKICRLHLSYQCKYGKDCNYIHICPRWLNGLRDDLKKRERRGGDHFPIKPWLPLSGDTIWRQKGTATVLSPTLGRLKGCTPIDHKPRFDFSSGSTQTLGSKNGGNPIQRVDHREHPIRIARYTDFEALNYDRWSICNDACALGERIKGTGVSIPKRTADS